MTKAVTQAILNLSNFGDGSITPDASLAGPTVRTSLRRSDAIRVVPEHLDGRQLCPEAGDSLSHHGVPTNGGFRRLCFQPVNAVVDGDLQAAICSASR